MRMWILLATCVCLAGAGCDSQGGPSRDGRRLAMGFGGGDDPPPVTGGEVPLPATTQLATWRAHVDPNDVAVSPRDFTIAIVDAGNDSVELLLRGGTHYRFVRGFQDPRCAAFLPDGRLLVGDAGTGAVRAYDRAGRAVFSLGEGAGEFEAPNDVAVDPSASHLFVVDSGTATVRAYGLDGSLAFSFGEGHLTFPTSAAVSHTTGEVFVGDAGRQSVEVFSADDGAWRRSLDRHGTGEGELSFVGGVHVDAADRLYVLEPVGGFLQVFDLEGGYLGRIGAHGSGPGELRSPKAVTTDSFGRLLVTSYLDREIEVWGLDDFEAPRDEVVTAKLTIHPRFLAPRVQRILVVVDVSGLTGELLRDSILLEGSVPPSGKARMLRIGKRSRRLFVPFATADVLAALGSAADAPTPLTLTALTADGRLVRGTAPVLVESLGRFGGKR